MLTKLDKRDRGAALPTFAIFLPVLVAFCAFVIDLGNWFEHHRHLQTQVDAAALAGGAAWSFPCSATSDTNIETATRLYGGPDASTAVAYNEQIGGTPRARLHLLLNSSNYYNQGGTDFSDGGHPCTTGFIDTKDTESNLRSYFPFGINVVPAINAHARVAIENAASVNNLLPLFVRDINPASAAAIWINDDTHTVISSAWMDKQATCGSGNQCFTSVATNVTVAARTSVIFALNSVPRCPAGGGACFTLPAAGASADTACNVAGTECFGEDANANLQAGLVFIRGYATTGGGAPPNPPALRDVELAGFNTGGATCSDGYFAYTGAACNIFIRAKVDVGTYATGCPGGSCKVQITANGANCGNNGCALTLQTAGANVGYWTGLIPIDPGSTGALQPITIHWNIKGNPISITGFGACNNNFNSNNPCQADFDGTGTPVQRFYRGQDQYSGPIRTATVWNNDGATPTAGFGANAYVLGSTHSMFATISIAGGVATSAADPAIQLRVAGSQSAIDCDPNVSTFREELTTGCQPAYTQNTHMTQADPCNPPYGTTPTALFNSPNPPAWQCVATQTGVSIGQFTDGIQGRVLNGGVVCTNCPKTCPANTAAFVPGRNYWASDWSGGTFTLSGGDPRVVVLFMVPFGAFRGTGNALFPITNFGAFYITGWGGNGGGNDDPCPGADPGVPGGWLSGHFIKYKLPSNNGGGTGQCDSSTNPCVAVLTQ